MRRKTPLPRGTGLARRSPLTAAPRTRVAPRDTGPSQKVRALVMAREGNCCAACGISVIGRPYSVQHRVARGMGGRATAAANALSNLVLLCGSAVTGCHGLAESRDPDMHDRGLWLWSWEDPALVPVMLASEHDSGVTVWLAADGTYLLEPPEEAAA